MVIRCPRCGGKRVSKNEKPNNLEWICDACNREFNSDGNSSFDDFDIDSAFAEVERRKKERLEREEKGIYVDENLDLLKGCGAEVLRIIYNKFSVSDIQYKPEKLNYIALNYPTNAIESAIKEAEEQIERERKEIIERERKERLEREKAERREKERLERKRKERERNERLKREEKGIYVDKSLDLLRGCSTGVIRSIYEEFPVSNIRYKPEKLNYIAFNYTTKDIERAIGEAEDYIIEKALYQHNYTKKSHKTVVNAIKTGKTRQKAADLVGVSLNDLTWWYNHGKQGESPYDSFYEDYTFARKIVQLKKEMKNEGIVSEEVDNIVNGWIKTGSIDDEVLRREKERKERIESERERKERERLAKEKRESRERESRESRERESRERLKRVVDQTNLTSNSKDKLYHKINNNIINDSYGLRVEIQKERREKERKERIKSERERRERRERSERERKERKRREFYNKEYRKKFNPKTGESYNDYWIRIENKKVQKKQMKKETIPKITSANDHTNNPRYYGDNKPQIRPKKQNKSNSSKKSLEKSEIQNLLLEYLNQFDNAKNKVMVERRIKAGEITTIQEINKTLIFENPKTNKERKNDFRWQYEQMIKKTTNEKPEREGLERERESSSPNDLSEDPWAVACCIVLMILFFIFSGSSGV